jgi:hypothetical protein
MAAIGGLPVWGCGANSFDERESFYAVSGLAHEAASADGGYRNIVQVAP